MKAVQIVGLFAGILTTSSLLPQLVQVFRTDDVEGFSLLFALWYIVGIAVWVAYGVLLKSFDVTLFNSFSLVIMLVILFRVMWVMRVHEKMRGVGGDVSSSVD